MQECHLKKKQKSECCSDFEIHCKNGCSPKQKVLRANEKVGSFCLSECWGETINYPGKQRGNSESES